MRLFHILIVLAVGMFAFNVARAQERQVQGYRTGVCEHFYPIRDTSGFQAFACGTLPRTVVVPDFYDLGQVLVDQAKKIKDLEARVKALEDRQNF